MKNNQNNKHKHVLFIYSTQGVTSLSLAVVYGLISVAKTVIRPLFNLRHHKGSTSRARALNLSGVFFAVINSSFVRQPSSTSRARALSLSGVQKTQGFQVCLTSRARLSNLLGAFATFGHKVHSTSRARALSGLCGQKNRLQTSSTSRARLSSLFGALLLILLILPLLNTQLPFLNPPQAQAATSNQLNFQGRLLTNTGSLVPDGTYNMEFNLYYVSTGGVSQWTEDRLNTNTQGVTIRNGYFSVYLGQYDTLPALDWSEDLYLGMTIRGSASCAWVSCTPADSEMTPRFKLTSVPYAFRAANVASSNTNAVSTNSDAVSITTGDALGATSNSGNISIDVGTATGTTGTLLFGTGNASALTIGRTGVTTTLQGSVALTGSGTALTVTNNVQVDGNTILGSNSADILTVNANATFTGSLTVQAGDVLTNAGSTLFTATAIADDADGGVLGGNAASTVDIATTLNVDQDTASQTFTLATPTVTTSGRIIYINNVGSSSMTLEGNPIASGSSASYIWNGTDWVQTISFTSTGVDTIGAIDSQAKSANGAVISGTTIYLQTADIDDVGLVSIGAQTFNGIKTFDDGLVVTAGGVTITSGALAVDSDSITSDGDLTITPAGGEVYIAGNLVVNAGQSLTVVGGNTASRPGSPTEGMVYFDTTTDSLLTYANGKWQSDRGEYIVVAANNSTQAEKDSADYVADGTADEVEINAALTAGADGKVHLLKGTYTIAGTILIDDNTTLEGTGDGTILFSVAGAASFNVIENADQVGGNSNITVRNLKIDGNNTNVSVGRDSMEFITVGSGDSGTSFVNGVIIENVTIINTETRGIELDTAFNSVIRNVKVLNGTNGHGIHLSSVFNVSITDSNISGNATNLQLSNVQDSRITNNTFNSAIANSNESIGILNGTTETVIANNIINNNGNYGIYVSSGGSAPNRVTIANNVIHDNADSAIFLGTASNFVITGNNFNDNDNTGSGSAILLSNADNSQITNNYIAEADNTYAINIQVASDNIYLADNRIVATNSITDAATTTIYAGQTAANSGNFRFRGANSTTAFAVQNATGTSVLNVNTSTAGVTVSGTLAVSGDSTLTGDIAINGDDITSDGDLTITPAGGDTTITGRLAVTTLGTADTSTYLCRNSTNIISGCLVSPISSSLADNVTDAFDLQEGANNYINVNTTNGSENISFGNATTNPSYNFLGSGTTTLGGNLSVTGTSGFTGLLSANGGLTVGSAPGVGQLTVNGSTVNSTLALGNFAAGGSIGSAATTVDIYTSISIAQTTTGQTLTVPTPTASTTYGRTIYLSNVGTASFSVLGNILAPGTSLAAIWSNTNGGASWQTSGTAKSGGAARTVSTSASGGASSAIASTNPSSADFINTSTTSAHTTINAALTAVGAAGGGTVVLMEGTYIIDGSISIPNNVTLSGVGLGTIIKFKNGINASFSGITNTDTVTGENVGVQNLKVDGNKANQSFSTDTFMRGILFNGVGDTTTRDGGRITNVYTYDVAGYFDTFGGEGVGVALSNTENTTISNVTSYGNSDVGVQLGASSRGNTISSSVIYDNGVGVSISTGSDNNTISGNVIRSNSGTGISIVSASLNSLIGNTVSSSGANGIVVTSSSQNIIEANNIYDNDSDGIALSTSSSSNTVTGNNIVNSGNTTGNFGISVYHDFNTVTNNVIADSSCTTTCSAIYIVAGADKTYLEGNRFTGSAANAASISDAGTGTIYAGQQTNTSTSTASDVSDFRFQGSANSATAFAVRNATGTSVFNVNTTTAGVTVAGTLTVSGANLTSLGGALTVTGLTTLNGGLTVEAGDTFTFNSDAFTDFTGGGLVNTGGVLTVDTTSATGAFINGGNAFTATSTLGNTGNYDLNIITNNITRLTVEADGDVVLAAGKSLTVVGGNTASRPGSPTEGMVYFDTTTDSLLTYANGKWQSDRGEYIVVAANDSTQAEKDSADYVADGTADQTEINSALTEAAGGKVILLAGTYVANATILIPNNTTLAGTGRGTLIQLADIDATDNLIENSDTTTGSGVAIRDIRLDGQDTLQTGTIDQHGIYFNSMGDGSTRQGGQILNVWANDFEDAAIYLSNSDNNNIIGNNAQGSSGTGIYLSSSVNNTINGNTTQSNTGAGIFISSSSNNVVTGNTSQSNAIGISLFVSTNNAVSGNAVQGNSGVGVYVDISANANTISGNTVQGNGEQGVYLGTSSNNNVISSNTIISNGGNATNNGIYITASDSNTITSNNISDTQCDTTCHAINIFDATSDKNYLADNYITDTDATYDDEVSINDAGTGTIYGNQMTPSETLQSSSTIIRASTSRTLTGTANPTASTTLNGTATSTRFVAELQVGDRITINAETRTVVSITDNDTLVVDTAFTDTANAAITRLPAALIVKNSAGANQVVVNDVGLATFYGGLTVETGDTFTFNGDAFTDFTGGGLVNTGGVLSVDATTATGFFQNGGNSFAGTATLGTNDNNSLVLRTNSTTALTINGSQAATFAGTLAVSGATLTVGTASTTTGGITFLNATNPFGVTVSAANQTVGSALISIPNTAGVADTFCLATVNNCANNNAFIQNGNSFAGTATLGTNDANSLVLETNNQSAVTIASGGAVVLQNAVDSTSALRVNNSSGNSIFSIDTTTTANLIGNNSFETNTTGWAVKNGSTITRITSDSYSGGASLQIVSPGTNDGGASFNYTLAATTQYTFSAYVKLASGTMTTAAIGRQDVSGVDISCGAKTLSTVNWVRLVCTFTTGGTITSSNIYIKDTSNTHTFLVDAVQLEQSEFSTAFNPGGKISLNGVIDGPVSFEDRVSIGNRGGTADRSPLFPTSTVNNLLNLSQEVTDFSVDSLRSFTNYTLLNPSATISNVILNNDLRLVIKSGNNQNVSAAMYGLQSVIENYGTGNYSSSSWAANFSNANYAANTVATQYGLQASSVTSAAATTSYGIGIRGYYTNSSTGTTTYGTGAQINVSNSGGGTITNGKGGQLYVTNSGAGTITTAYGGEVYVDNTGSGSIPTAIALRAYGLNSGTATMTTFTGLDVSFTNSNAAATITDTYGLYVRTPTNSGTISNSYGFYVQGQGTAAQSYGGVIASGSNYGLVIGGGNAIGLTVQGAGTTGIGAVISNGSSTGNILQLEDNTTRVLVVADGGNLGLKTGTNSIASAYDLTFGDGSNRTLGVLTTTTNAAGYNLTVQAGNAGAGGSAFVGGTLTLQGGAAGGTGNANGGNVVLTGGAGTGTGVKGLLVVDTATFSASIVQNFTSSGNITQANIDSYGSILITSDASGYTATLTDPTITTAGRIIYVSNSGLYDMTLSVNGGGQGNTVTLKPNTTATMVWNGSDWTAAGASSSTDLQAAYNNTATSAGGAELVLNASGGAADGLTVRNNATTPIIGGLLEVQSSIGSNLFSVNNNATEYATNGGAETLGASASTFPANTWDTTTGGTVDRYTTVGDNIATGAASTRVQTTTTNHGARNRLSTTLTDGLTYTVSFAVRGATNFTSLEVLYSPDGTTSGTTTCATGKTVTAGAWTRVTCSFIASGTITSSNSILIRQTDATARTFYLDNLSVNVNASATFASDGSVDSALGTNWTNFGTLDALTRDTSIIYDTSGSVAVDTPNATDRGVRNNLGITPAVNTQYLVTFYARSTNTFNDIRVRYSRDGGTNFVSCIDYNTQSVSIVSFTKITCLFTTDGTTATDADLIIDQPTGSDRIFYIDALTVTINTNNSNNVQIGGGNKGGPVTLFTLDRSAGAPIAANNDAYLGSMYYDTLTGRIQCYESGGWGTCGAPPDNIVNLNPEYAGSVLNGTGVGTMQADVCANEVGVLQVNSTLCATGEARNFYQWTSPQATQQTYSIYVTYQLPSTFDGFSSDDTVQLTARVDSTTNAAVTYEMFKSQAGTLTKCGTGETTVATTANTWQTVGINGNESTGCSFNSSSANGFVLFKLNLKANSNANAYVSTLTFTTTGR